ncbi:MAG: 23S rRNA (adenine(2503)-C(2))-methyltransferase RlmN [Treponema sp.]|nr:23S rRNA (adenine(2503)-C(2))-methyltransferase RlmN [Treponema sp.]
MESIVLTELSPEEIKLKFSLEKSFRAVQIFEWIYKGIDSFDKMTNISLPLRKKLEESASLRCSKITNELNDTDGTIKLQITTHDNLAIETVLLKDRQGRKTACVSSQAGCPMKCAFCKTGTLGLARNLTVAEIIEQFLFLERVSGTLDNIVFMGMGEPLANLSNVRKSISLLTDKRGRNLSARRITISTCGLLEKIYELADNGPHVRLALSLVVADDILRKRLMPGSNATIEELKKAVRYYSEKSLRRVTLEAVLLSGLNTSRNCADKLIDFAKDLNVNINLIPWNKVENLPFKTPSEKEVNNFSAMLKKENLNVSIRTHRGRNISGACGQLGRTNM